MTRIQELAEQAKKSVPQGILTPDKWIEEYNRIFAELIISECAMVVEGFEITQEVALDEYVDYEASAVLKQHFGVNHE